MTLPKLQCLDENFYLVIVTGKIVMWRQKKVKATKNGCCFNRYSFSLDRNKARSSVSQIFVTVTNIYFFCVLEIFEDKSL